MASRSLRAALTAALALSARAAGAEGAAWSLLPDSHVLAVERAAVESPCRTEIALSRDAAREGSFLTYLVGNDLAFVALDLGPRRLVLGGMGFIRAEFERSSDSWELQCGDYKAGLCASYADELLAAELSYYHLSAHYGDDLLREMEPVARDLGWEAIGLAVSLPRERALRPYAAAELKTGRRPRSLVDDRLSALVGLAWTAPFDSFPARLSAEARLLEPGSGLGFGLRLDCPLVRARPARPGGRAFGHELFLRWYRGPSSEGVFYGVDENRFSAGLGLDI